MSYRPYLFPDCFGSISAFDSSDYNTFSNDCMVFVPDGTRFWCILSYFRYITCPNHSCISEWYGSSIDLVWYIWVCIRRMQLLSWTQSEVHHHSVSDGILHSVSHWRLMFWPNKPSGLIRVWQRLCNPPHTQKTRFFAQAALEKVSLEFAKCPRRLLFCWDKGIRAADLSACQSPCSPLL